MNRTREIVPTICLDRPAIALHADANGVEHPEVPMRPAAYAGKVVLRALTYEERMDIVDMEIGEGDTEETVSERIKKKGNMKMVRLLAKRLPEFVVSVDIKRLDDGYHFTTLDDLLIDSDMAGTVTELALALVAKYRVGNAPSTV